MSSVYSKPSTTRPSTVADDEKALKDVPWVRFDMKVACAVVMPDGEEDERMFTYLHQDLVESTQIYAARLPDEAVQLTDEQTMRLLEKVVLKFAGILSQAALKAGFFPMGSIPEGMFLTDSESAQRVGVGETTLVVTKDSIEELPELPREQMH